MHQINEGQNGRVVEVHSGESFVIRLPEKPTTGFRWHFITKGEPTCELVTDTFEADSKLVGGGGERFWTFRAAHSGSARIELAHKRAWETIAPGATFAIDVRVSP